MEKLVASIAVYNEDGLLLFGKRGDNGKWCMPGGKFELKEWPTNAALRELFEETALVPLSSMDFIGTAYVPRAKVQVYSFKCKVNQEPKTKFDPDSEFVEFRWVKPERIPNEIMDNLHNKQDVTLQKLGLQEETLKSEAPNWRSKDGLVVPTANNPYRLVWNEKYINLITQTFMKNDEKLIECWVDASKVNGYNSAINQTRLKLYKNILQSGEETPPVVLRYDNDGLNLLDGNHRQEAARQVGIQYIKAVVIWDDSNLEKAVGGIGAMMASGLLMGGALNPNIPQPTTHAVEPGVGIKAWTPENLHEDLHPIAMLESSGGKNLVHKKNPAGEYHTAFGALGFKPSTAHEEYKKSPLMQKNYPGLADPAVFLKAFRADPKFYNLLASAHFTRLKARHGDENKAAYAWRHGSGAARLASETLMENDPYVLQYAAMRKKK